MISQFRKLSQHFLMKFVFGAIIFSFIGWGISDVIKGTQSDYIAKVAGRSINFDMLQSKISSEKAKLYKAYGDKINEEYFKDSGFAFQILGSMISEIMLEEEAYNIGIRHSNDYVSSKIKEAELFKDDNGNFSIVKYKDVLSNMKVTEKKYINQLRKELSRDLLVNIILSGDFKIPGASSIISSVNSASRNIDIYEVDGTKIKDIKSRDSDLKNLFDELKYTMTIPEKRSLLYVKLDKNDFIRDISITDEDINAEYESRGYKDHSQKLESLKPKIVEELKQKKLNKILSESIEKIEDKISAGDSLDDVAKLFGVKVKKLEDISINSDQVEKISHELNNMFGYGKDDDPQVLYDQYKNTYFIAKVDKIIPQSFQSFETSKVHLENIYKDRYITNKISEAISAGLSEEKLAFIKNSGALNTISNLEIIDPNGISSRYPEALINDIYSSAKIGYITGVYNGSTDRRYFAKINNISMKKADLSLIDENTEKSINRRISQEILEDYLQKLRVKYNLKINKGYLSKILEQE